MNHLIIDGHNLLFRCGHTTGHLTLADGTPCGAAWGFVRSLLVSYRAELGSTGGKVHVVWDGGRSPRRKNLLPTYKSNRDPNPEAELTEKEEIRQAEREDILGQVSMCQSLLAMLGVKQYQGHKVEADDVIAALVEALTNDPANVVSVLSGDEDFLQLSKPGVILVTPTGKRIYPEDLPRPSETVLVKCMAGCKSDNIPGFTGIGDVTATRFLDWLRNELGNTRCVQLPDLCRQSIFEGPHVVSPTGRVKTAIKAINGGFPVIERNYTLVCLNEALAWQEVWDTAASGWTRPESVQDFQREVRRMAWHSMEQLFPEAVAVASKKPV